MLNTAHHSMYFTLYYGLGIFSALDQNTKSISMCVWVGGGGGGVMAITHAWRFSAFAVSHNSLHNLHTLHNLLIQKVAKVK